MEPKESKRIQKRHDRIPSDNYATPTEIAKWTVDRCLAISERYCGKSTRKLTMLEPGCGDTAPFSRYAASLGMSAFGVDSREVGRRPDVTVFDGTSFLDMPCESTAALYSRKYDVIATNPPFIYGIEFVIRALDILSPRGVIAFNMKLAFMASQGRYDFFEKRPPSEVHILSKRPSYAHGATDRGQEYGIYFWNGEEVAQKIRNKYGRIARVHWQKNAEWPKPNLPDGVGERVVVAK
jgi:hypothetical protein